MDLEQEALETFLSMPLYDTREIFQRFQTIPGAAYFEGELPKERFLYVRGLRRDKILFIAHADTVWDTAYRKEQLCQKPILDMYEVYHGTNPGCGIGADDRAGCAILWLLKESGHSILLTDGEERGEIGAQYLAKHNPALLKELNAHQYMAQLDLKNSGSCKYYDIPVTEEFARYIEGKTGLVNAGSKNRTDIVVLCREICGVNISVGYHREHLAQETLCLQEWREAFERVSLLAGAKDIPRFELHKEEKRSVNNAFI